MVLRDNLRKLLIRQRFIGNIIEYIVFPKLLYNILAASCC